MSDDYSDTPRTNKLMNSIPFEQIARQFERELAAVTRERDDAHASLEDADVEIAKLTRERDEDQGVIAVWRGRTQRAEDERDALRAEVERLTSAIRWALGYDEGPPDFEPPDDADKRRYWWRNELTRRAALTPAEGPKT